MLKSGVHPPEFYKSMWETLAGGGEWRGEMCNRRKDGTLFWEQTSICSIRNAQGEIAHFMAVKEDITEWKRDEAQIASWPGFPAKTPIRCCGLTTAAAFSTATRPARCLAEVWQCREGELVPDRFREVVLDSLASGRTRETNASVANECFASFEPIVGAWRRRGP